MRNTAHKILTTYGGISQKDYDDFYSVANETIAKAILGYDDTGNFDTYIYYCIANKIKTEMTRRNRFKRIADRTSVSIDATLTDDSGVTLLNITAKSYGEGEKLLGYIRFLMYNKR